MFACATIVWCCFDVVSLSLHVSRVTSSRHVLSHLCVPCHLRVFLSSLSTVSVTRLSLVSVYHFTYKSLCVLSHSLHHMRRNGSQRPLELLQEKEQPPPTPPLNAQHCTESWLHLETSQQVCKGSILQCRYMYEYVTDCTGATHASDRVLRPCCAC